MRIAIIGGGLAGCAAAYVLKQQGHEPVIYESSQTLASGASGNDVGLYNPRFTAEFNAEGQFYSAAFFMAIKTFENLADIDFNPCGALHLINDDKKAKRFPQTVKNWNWGEEKMRILTPAQSSQIAGINISAPSLYLSESGTVCPKKLCRAYTTGIDIQTNILITDLTMVKADAIILAGGSNILQCDQSKSIPLKPVRGQVTYIQATEKTENLKTTIGYGGYVAPAMNGQHCVGSTFQPWLSHNEIIPQDDIDNITKLGENIPSLKSDHIITHQRAGVRMTSKDHFPVVGEIDKNIYISAAHGSHGILSTLISAKILANKISGKSSPYHETILGALHPFRFDKT